EPSRRAPAGCREQLVAPDRVSLAFTYFSTLEQRTSYLSLFLVFGQPWLTTLEPENSNKTLQLDAIRELGTRDAYPFLS
ncbi:MAG: hypothetical protein ACRD22_19600, partial [Terriglobia bacterium]